MENMSVTVSCPIDFWTQYRASRAIVNRTWGTIFGWGFFVGLPLVALILMLATGHEVSAPAVFGLPGWTVVIGGLLFMLVFMPLTHVLNVWSYRRRNRSVAGVHTYAINPEGYSVRGSVFNTEIKWDVILKAVETKRFILLYVASRWAHFIPKSAASPVDLATIRTILYEKLGPKARLQQEA